VSNPWMQQHINGELEYTGGEYTSREAVRRVKFEFAGAPDPIPCGCGKKAFYRATVGAMQCPSCGSLYRTSGKLVTQRW
jgi:ribosomal protein L37AE/L43A